MYGFEHGGGAAVGINRAVDPGVAVISDHHPLLRFSTAFDVARHVPERAELVILLQVHFYARRPRPDVIGER